MEVSSTIQVARYRRKQADDAVRQEGADKGDELALTAAFARRTRQAPTKVTPITGTAATNPEPGSVGIDIAAGVTDLVPLPAIAHNVRS